MQTAPAAADLGSVEALDEQISSFASLAGGDARRRNFHASSQGQAESLVLNAAPKAWRVWFRSTPVNGHRQAAPACLKSADIVAKVENRTTRRISLKSILGRACCRKALRRQYEGRWSFWYETMWSLMSPHAKRISGL